MIFRFSSKGGGNVYLYNPCYPFSTHNGCVDVAVSHGHIVTCVIATVATYSYIVTCIKISHSFTSSEYSYL